MGRKDRPLDEDPGKGRKRTRERGKDKRPEGSGFAGLDDLVKGTEGVERRDPKKVTREKSDGKKLVDHIKADLASRSTTSPEVAESKPIELTGKALSDGWDKYLGKLSQEEAKSIRAQFSVPNEDERDRTLIEKHRANFDPGHVLVLKQREEEEARRKEASEKEAARVAETKRKSEERATAERITKEAEAKRPKIAEDDRVKQEFQVSGEQILERTPGYIEELGKTNPEEAAVVQEALDARKMSGDPQYVTTSGDSWENLGKSDIVRRADAAIRNKYAADVLESGMMAQQNEGEKIPLEEKTPEEVEREREAALQAKRERELAAILSPQEILEKLQDKQINIYDPYGNLEGGYTLQDITVRNDIRLARITSPNHMESVYKPLDELLEANQIDQPKLAGVNNQTAYETLISAAEDRHIGPLVSDFFVHNGKFAELSSEARRAIADVYLAAFNSTPKVERRPGGEIREYQTPFVPAVKEDLVKEPEVPPTSAETSAAPETLPPPKRFADLGPIAADRPLMIRMKEFLSKNRGAVNNMAINIGGRVVFGVSGLTSVRDALVYVVDRAKVRGGLGVGGVGETMTNVLLERKSQHERRAENTRIGNEIAQLKGLGVRTEAQQAQLESLQAQLASRQVKRDVYSSELNRLDRFESGVIRPNKKKFKGQLASVRGGAEKGSEARNLLALQLRNERARALEMTDDAIRAEARGFVANYLDTKITGIEAARGATNSALLTASVAAGMPYLASARVLSMGIADALQKKQSMERTMNVGRKSAKIQEALQARRAGRKVESSPDIMQEVDIKMAAWLGVQQTVRHMFERSRGTGEKERAQYRMNKIKAWSTVLNYAATAGGSAWVSREISQGIGKISSYFSPAEHGEQIDQVLKVEEVREPRSMRLLPSSRPPIVRTWGGLESNLPFSPEAAQRFQAAQSTVRLAQAEGASPMNPTLLSDKAIKAIEATQEASANPIGSIPLETSPGINLESAKEAIANRTVWGDAGIETESRFAAQLDRVAKALGGKDSPQFRRIVEQNQNRLSSIVESDPQRYGLPERVNFNSMSAEQIRSVNWDKAFQDTFGKNPSIEISRPTLNAIVANNPEVKTFFENNTAPVTPRSVELVLSGKQEALIEAAKQPVEAPLVGQMVANPEAETLVAPEIAPGATQKLLANTEALRTEIRQVLGDQRADVELFKKVGAQSDHNFVAALKKFMGDRKIENPAEAIRELHRLNDESALRGLSEAARSEGTVRFLTPEDSERIALTTAEPDEAKFKWAEEEHLRVHQTPQGTHVELAPNTSVEKLPDAILVVTKEEIETTSYEKMQKLADRYLETFDDETRHKASRWAEMAQRYRQQPGSLREGIKNGVPFRVEMGEDFGITYVENGNTYHYEAPPKELRENEYFERAFMKGIKVATRDAYDKIRNDTVLNPGDRKTFGAVTVSMDKKETITVETRAGDIQKWPNPRVSESEAPRNGSGVGKQGDLQAEQTPGPRARERYNRRIRSEDTTRARVESEPAERFQRWRTNTTRITPKVAEEAKEFQQKIEQPPVKSSPMAAPSVSGEDLGKLGDSFFREFETNNRAIEFYNWQREASLMHLKPSGSTVQSDPFIGKQVSTMDPDGDIHKIVGGKEQIIKVPSSEVLRHPYARAVLEKLDADYRKRFSEELDRLKLGTTAKGSVNPNAFIDRAGNIVHKSGGGTEIWPNPDGGSSFFHLAPDGSME